jgi:hypothetical protein
MANNFDYLEIKIPFDANNPLALKDLQGYFARLENYFQSNGIDIEIYDAEVGSFIPKLRQVGQALVTLSAIIGPLLPIFLKVQNNQPLSLQEQRNIQPILVIGSNNNIKVQNINYNGTNYNTSKFDTSGLVLAQKQPPESSINTEPKKYQSQALVFTKINVSGKNTQCAGKIESIDIGNKKVTFITQDVKEEFAFVETDKPFEHTYLVDLNVHYNPDGSIAYYEILGLIDKENHKSTQMVP